MDTGSEVENRLLDFGIKPSLQRIAILTYLMEHFTHPTAGAIFDDLHPVRPTLSKKMVYSTLKLLAEQGAIHVISVDDKNQRYDADTSCHAHFKCKQCGSVHDIPIKDRATFKIKNPGDLILTECQVYYKGYCKQCKDAFIQNSIFI